MGSGHTPILAVKNLIPKVIPKNKVLQFSELKSQLLFISCIKQGFDSYFSPINADNVTRPSDSRVLGAVTEEDSEAPTPARDHASYMEFSFCVGSV